MLSGNKDTDALILMKLNDKDLSSICQINSYISSLCSDDTFWRNRVLYRFRLPINITNEIKDYLSWTSNPWKEYYFWLTSILVYKHAKKLKVDDFLFEFPNLYVIASYRKNLIHNISYISLLEKKVQELQLKSLPSWLGNDFIVKVRRKLFKEIFVHKIDANTIEEEIEKEFYSILEEVKTIFTHSYL